MMAGSPPGQTRSSAQAPPCATDMSLMIQSKKRYAKSRKKDNKKQVDVIEIRESGLFMRGGGVRLLRAAGKCT